MENGQQKIDEYSQVLKIRLPPPMPERNYKLSGKYSIFLPEYQTTVIRKYDIVTGSEGVDVFLDLRNSHYRVSPKDIASCEIELLRWANLPLSIPIVEENRKLLVEYLEGQVNALKFRDIEHENMEYSRSRGLSQKP